MLERLLREQYGLSLRHARRAAEGTFVKRRLTTGRAVFII